MKKKNLKKSQNSIIDPIASSVALIHFTVSFFTDRLFFDYWPPLGTDKLIRLTIFKGLFLVVLILIWHAVFNIVRKIRDKSVNMTWLKCSLAYFSALFLLTICAWPGFWEWDEFYILAANVNLHIHVWQSMLSNIIYALSLMILPFPTGVVLVQIVFVSVIVGYVLSFAFEEFKPGIAGKIILWIPFFILPVLYYAQAPIRLGFYSFLELLFITMLYKLCKYGSWTMGESILAVVLVSVIATWRTEGIYYLVIAPILIWVFMKDKDRRYKAVLTVFIVILTLLQYFVQSHLYKSSTSDDYEITAYINPVEELVGYAADHDPDEADNELINEIGRVFDTDILISNYQAGIRGVDTFWQRKAIKDHTEDDLKAMKSAYVKLIMKYPEVFIKERLRMYWHSDMLIGSTLDLYNDERDMAVGFVNNYNLTGPVNQKVRSFIVNLIETNNSPMLHNVLWHPFAPQLILLLIMIYCLIRKKYGYSGMLFLVLARVPLVIVTAPEKYFMYYFPTYLIGLFACACVLARLFSRSDKQERSWGN